MKKFSGDIAFVLSTKRKNYKPYYTLGILDNQNKALTKGKNVG